MEQRFEVSGMSYGHCVRAITGAVKGGDPTAADRVDLARRTVPVHGEADRARLGAAIADAGQEVEGMAARNPETRRGGVKTLPAPTGAALGGTGPGAAPASRPALGDP